ncbi:hypothetical protein V6L77_12275 [Pannonibacter sp. Pt2-lr]
MRLFAAACALPDQIVDPSSNPAMAGGTGDLACTELGGIRSLDGGFRGRMLFRNARGGPIDVFWIDYSGIQQFYARLEPGQVLDQESIISNAWLVTTDVGQCLGIYISREPQQTVVIGQPSGSTMPVPQGLPQGLSPRAARAASTSASDSGHVAATRARRQCQHHELYLHRRYRPAGRL